MKKKRALLALATSAAAAVLFALPANAFAADKTLTQTDFTTDGSICVIDEAGTYTLESDITGTVRVELDNRYGNVVIDLNGKKLSNADDSATGVDLVDVRNSNVTVKNGTLVSHNNSVVRTNSMPSCNVTLDSVTATSYNHHCIDIAVGNVTVKSGTYSAVINGESTDKWNVLLAETQGKATVEGGVFTGGNGDIVDGSVTLAGGSFAELPLKGRLEDGKAVACVAGDNDSVTYEVKSLADARGNNKGAVLSAEKLDIVFFSTYEAAQAAATELGSLAVAYEVKDHAVTYKDNGETYQSETVHFYDQAPVITPPSSSSDQGFKSWQLNGADYEFSRPVVTDLELVATWGDPIVQVITNGVATKYANLKIAAEAAVDGSQVYLLVDCAGDGIGFLNKNNIVLNLGGKTLTGMVMAQGCNGLVVTNGTIKASADAAAFLYKSSSTFDGVNVMWAEDSDDKESPLVYIKEGSVAVNGGTFTATEGNALEVEDATSAVFNNGSFESDSEHAVALNNCDRVTVNGGEFVAKDEVAFGVFDCSVVEIKDGKFIAENDNAVYIDSGSCAPAAVHISGGEFTGKYDYGTEESPYWINECVYVGEASIFVITGGTFNDNIDTGYLDSGVAQFQGGTFGDYVNAKDVASGYAMLKRAGGKYAVLSQSAAKSEANWLLTAKEAGVSYEVYFVSKDEAQTVCDEINGRYGTATLTAVEHSDYDPYTAADRAAAKKVADQLAQVQEDYSQVASDNAQAAGDAAQTALGAYDALTKLQKELVSAKSVSAVQSILDQGRARVAADMITAVLEKYVPVTAANAQDALDAANAAITAYGDLSAEQRELAKQYAGDGNFDVMVDVRDAAQAQVTANSGDKEALAAVQKKVVKVVKLTKKEKKAGKKTLKARAVTVKAKRSASGAKASWAKVSATKGLKVKGGKVTLKKGAKKGTYTAKLRVSYGAYSKTVKVVFRVK